MGWSGNAGRSMWIPLAALGVLVALAAMVVMRATGPEAGAPDGVVLLCDEAIEPVMRDIVNAFHRRSDVQVEAYFGASADLLERLRNQPRSVDVFVPADALFVEEAEEEGLIGETVTLAWAAPVILVQEGNPLGIEGVEDLDGPEVRLALAEDGESVVGRIAPAVFERHGLTMDEARVETAIRRGTLSGLGNAIRLGQADAAILWEPMAAEFPRSEIIAIPPETNAITEIRAGLSASAPRAPDAGEFLEFLTQSAARAHFERGRFALECPGS